MKSLLSVLVTAALAAGAVLAGAPEAEAKTVPLGPYAAAWWVNGTLTVVYPFMGPFTDGASDAAVRVEVDGKVVDSPDDYFDGERVVALPRDASAGPAEVRVISDSLTDRGSYSDVASTVYFASTVQPRLLTAAPGQVETVAMLDGLEVAKETRAVYRGAAFRIGTEAQASRRSRITRDRVLTAESTETITRGRDRLVRTGSWDSVYDGVTVRKASGLVLDRLVPLSEAWVSGASAWSAKRRTAFANDLAFANALTVATPAAHRAKGGKEPTTWLPEGRGAVCGYARDWIAVKHRWGLSIDPAEKAALAAALTRSCSDPFIDVPPSPDVKALLKR